MAGKVTKPIAPVYFVAGNDEFNKDKKVKEILRKSLPAENKDLNYTEIECKGKAGGEEDEDGDPAESEEESGSRRAKSNFVFDFDSTIKTVPFLADRRVVVLREFEKLRKDLKDTLLEYVKTPVESTVLILVSKDVKKSDFEKGAAYKKISAAASSTTFTYYQLYPNQLGSEIKKKLSELGKTISQEAVDILVERVGSNMRDLDSEIEKVILYIGDKKHVDEVDVEFLVSGLDARNIFDFVNALAERNLVKSLKIIDDIFYVYDKHAAGPMIVGAVYGHFKKIWTAKVLLRAGIPENSIAGKLGVHPYFISGLLTQARFYDEKQLKTIFSELAKTDKETKRKSGKMPSQVIESLVYKLLLK
ncbi:MAG: DNA polymerase III subunit delta [Candidatus Firestonebacteria bacterium RIFOXYC2_FULL_39_67]|nr:MAG: DNA polymerase III subunit delta [Candidatus Firestonebacteria bacterium RIFOXYD2_FULL_39_29]OGF56165.1 MAG: DNA polymerase III subunit delta [Candidatus Firestonebacteria bacterium RifOxyC12_full_39_7]OGF56664.1 MAG: DNA polymerase III subunit delta [Candidatus Firestonebacteria bacterium RIFOXYC2_FULL_39_67]